VPKKHLTDLFCERVKAPERGRVEYFDSAFGGLALRVTEKGVRTFSVHYRLNGKLRRFTLGQYPTIKPAQARREASAALELARHGTDPTAAKRELRYKRELAADTFGAVAKDYLERHLAKNTASGTATEAMRTLTRDVLPIWRQRPISSITRRDVIDLIDSTVARGAPIHANRLLARLRALFNWAIEKDRLQASPIEGMKLPTKERPRDRALSDDEIRWFWPACSEEGWPFGFIAQLLLLTAQRRDEVAQMEWQELDLSKRTWTIRRERAKNGRTHEVHLSDLAMDMLRSLPRVGDRYVFTTTGDGPVDGFSRAKTRIDASMAALRRREIALRVNQHGHMKAIEVGTETLVLAEIPHWVLHDLRRTAATGMARLNVPRHVVDKILNHVSGTIRGVAAVYNRFEYHRERQAALDDWAKFVGQLVCPPQTARVAIRA
jgi:integrase